jgi:hypothetical protein
LEGSALRFLVIAWYSFMPLSSLYPAAGPESKSDYAKMQEENMLASRELVLAIESLKTGC